MNTLEERKEKLLKYLQKDNLKAGSYFSLAFLIFIGIYIRTRNLEHMQGKYPLALDPFLFLRYAKEIVANGKIATLDAMRNYPLGIETKQTAPLVAYVVAYLYKIIHIFIPSITVEQVDIIYPVIFFILGMIVFYLLVEKVFNYKVALLSSAFLVVLPPYLYRTMAGFSDKEALGMFLMFSVFYAYVLGIKSKEKKKNIAFGLVAGLLTGLLALAWGGIQIVVFTIAIFSILEIFLGKFRKKDMYIYIPWYTVTVLMMTLLTQKYGGLGTFFTSIIYGSATLVLFLAIFKEFFIKNETAKEKLKGKLPLSIASFGLATILIGLISSLIYGISFVPHQIRGIINQMLVLGQSRWTLTVAESHQPYFTDWISNFTWLYIILFFIGSVVLFYFALKKVERYSYKLSGAYALFMVVFMLSRYSAGSVLNGSSNLSALLIFGSFICFFSYLIYIYIYTYRTDMESFMGFAKINKGYILMFVWFVILMIGAREAIRLIFVFTPITTIFAAYPLVKLFDYCVKKKDKTIKILGMIGILIILYLILVPFYQGSLGAAKSTGPSYNMQWQVAMDWVRENTPEDSVFAHWWDYGYWIQTGGGRATLTDGGNFIVYWNHLIGRHVITGQSEEEALSLLKSHDATHLLIISDEIGKYPAFSSIGSDENYDRYSQIGTFRQDPQMIQETRNQTIYVYKGFGINDNDTIINGQLFPGWNSAIVGFLLPIEKNEARQAISIKQPISVWNYKNNQIQVPLGCVFMEGEEYNFEGASDNGCLILIPTIDGQEMNPIGGAIYVSEKVRRTLFTQLYLMGKSSEYFKEVYNDKNSMPLALYQGRLIGPLKIWEISYPEGMVKNESHLEITFPNPELQEAKM